jgi:glucokinase
VSEENLPCPCGNTGCWEAAAAGPGISLRYKTLTGKSFSAKEIAENARNRDEAAISVYKKTGEYIGRAVAAAVNVVNVPLVVIGGGISLDYDLLKEDIDKTVQAQIYRGANKGLIIMQTKLGYHASIIGAAANKLKSLTLGFVS